MDKILSQRYSLLSNAIVVVITMYIMMHTPILMQVHDLTNFGFNV